MKKIELLELLVKNAREYRKKAKRSLAVDHHMNFIGDKIGKYKISTLENSDFDKQVVHIIKEQQKFAKKEVNKIYSQNMVDAILVSFINYVAAIQGVDYGIYTRDLKNDKEKIK